MNTGTETNTLVALFDDYNSAQAAARQLETAGISKSDIEIRSNQKTMGAGSSGSYTDSDQSDKEEGGFSGWLHNLFSGDSSAGHYDEGLRRGNAVLTVNLAGQNYDSAVSILNENGAVDIDKRAASWGESGYTGYRNDSESGTLPVIEEELQVGKRVVQKGGVRVYSRVIDQPVEEQISLREEQVRVERRPANRPVADAELGALRDQTIEVTQMAEEPVISKRARVVEEVVVGKDSSERTETVRDSVRRTEVTVDNLDSASTGNYSQYGARYAGDARFKDMTWDNAEQDIRTDYLRSNPNSTWDEVRNSVRSGWDKAKSKV